MSSYLNYCCPELTRLGNFLVLMIWSKELSLKRFSSKSDDVTGSFAWHRMPFPSFLPCLWFSLWWKIFSGLMIFFSSTSYTTRTYFQVCLLNGSARIFPTSYPTTGIQTHVSSFAPPWSSFIQDALLTELLRPRQPLAWYFLIIEGTVSNGNYYFM